MTEEKLLGLLESGDYDKMKLALIYIEKQLEEMPSPKLITKLVELCSDNDPDIKAEAIMAAGFYWQLPEVFSVLVAILARADEDDIVLNAAVFAISTMAENQPSLEDDALKVLAQVALNESMPEVERKSAYALALRLTRRISINDFAKMSVSSDVVIDKDYMASLSSERSVEKKKSEE